MVNEIMDAQADMACEDGATARNGYRERGLVTPVGNIVLCKPKLRAGTYFPKGIIERCSHADRAVATAVAESWANGVSTRKMVLLEHLLYLVPVMPREADVRPSGIALLPVGHSDLPLFPGPLSGPREREVLILIATRTAKPSNRFAQLANLGTMNSRM